MSLHPYTISGNDPNPRDTDGTMIIGTRIRRNIRQQRINISSGVRTKIPASPLSGRNFISIFNISTTGAIAYWGNDSVTTDTNASTDGDPVYPRAKEIIYIDDAVDIYVIPDNDCILRIVEGS